jgi:hypothetical protein
MTEFTKAPDNRRLLFAPVRYCQFSGIPGATCHAQAMTNPTPPASWPPLTNAANGGSGSVLAPDRLWTNPDFSSTRSLRAILSNVQAPDGGPNHNSIIHAFNSIIHSIRWQEVL